MILNVESVAEIPKCDHSNESYWAVLSCGDVLIFESVGEIQKLLRRAKYHLE